MMIFARISLKDFATTEFTKHVGTLLTGNAASQIITYAAVPIITRLFRPEDFGVFAIFGALVGLLSKFCSLSYSQAVLLPASNVEAMRLAQLSAIIILFVALLLFPIFAFGSWTANLFPLNTPRFWLALLPLAVAFSAYNTLLINLHVREGRYRVVGCARVIEAFVSATIKVCVGICFGSSVGGLLGGLLGGMLASMILLALLFKADIEPATSQEPENRDKRSHCTLRAVAGKYKKFPIFVTLTQTINVLSQKVVVFIFAAFFPPGVVGNYNLAQRVVSNPTGLLSNAVQKVYFQKSAAQVANNISVLPNLKKLIGGLALLGLVPFSLLVIAGQPIFVFAFGDEWAAGGMYAQLIAPWLYLKFVTNPARIVFYVYQRQEILFIMNLIALCMSAGALILGAIMYRSVTRALLCFVLAGSVTELVTCALAFREARGH